MSAFRAASSAASPGIQALGDVAAGETIIATLRAVLHKRREILSAAFTGSSQENMTRMLSTAGAPMYQFAQRPRAAVLAGC